MPLGLLIFPSNICLRFSTGIFNSSFLSFFSFFCGHNHVTMQILMITCLGLKLKSYSDVTLGDIIRTGRPQWYSQGPGHRKIVTQCRILALGHRVRWPGLGSRRSARPISLYHFPHLYPFPLSQISQVDTIYMRPSFCQFRISMHAVGVKG